ncbi:hypothetical protein Anapl_18957 [Anas platyrhynchos]|uniref:Uncharacterized protein n=1 Tax=Anas platyrhynchos TaxID=8839 RepID=R0L7H8_ANAPL|nr:hypothetical protein Anapl_18957 [Anas platyrhynchos]
MLCFLLWSLHLKSTLDACPCIPTHSMAAKAAFALWFESTGLLRTPELKDLLVAVSSHEVNRHALSHRRVVAAHGGKQLRAKRYGQSFVHKELAASIGNQSDGEPGNARPRLGPSLERKQMPATALVQVLRKTSRRDRCSTGRLTHAAATTLSGSGTTNKVNEQEPASRVSAVLTATPFKGRGRILSRCKQEEFPEKLHAEERYQKGPFGNQNHRSALSPRHYTQQGSVSTASYFSLEKNNSQLQKISPDFLGNASGRKARAVTMCKTTRAQSCFRPSRRKSVTADFIASHPIDTWGEEILCGRIRVRIGHPSSVPNEGLDPQQHSRTSLSNSISALLACKIPEHLDAPVSRNKCL